MTLGPIVAVEGGSLQGSIVEPGVEAFLGVPFAAPPTGRLRWAPPAPAAPWTGVRDATRSRPVCPQPARPFSEWAHGPLPPTDEDSLTANVWRPAGAAGKSVLVFLHGGGWAIGWGSNPLLDGRHLAAALDAVIVTVNYRLGSLGWLHHPALAADADEPTGNWGLLDQLAALRWVNQNIEAFGGDRTRVTLGGESAGAGSVLHLIGHPGARDLFTRAVTLSPPLHELVIDADLGERWTAALAASLDLGGDVAAALPQMRELPADTIVAAQERLLAGEFKGTRGGAMPIVDPASLPADPATVAAAAAQIPLLIGTNAQEATFFFRAAGRRIDPDPDQLQATIARITHTDPDAARKTIDDSKARLAAEGTTDPSANDILCAAVTEAWFAGPVRRYAAARAAAGATVHRYRIDHPSPDPDNLGALHTISVPLLFGTWQEGGVPARLAGNSPATKAVTAALQADVKRFIHGEKLEWQPIQSDADSEQVVYGGSQAPRTISPLRAE